VSSLLDLGWRRIASLMAFFLLLSVPISREFKLNRYRD
jgi:hypothetical protein